MTDMIIDGARVAARSELRISTYEEDRKLELRGAPRKRPVSELIIHETVTRDVATTLRVLRKRRLGVHFIIAPDGEVLQLADPARTRLEHAAPHNVRSVGVEIVNPVEPRFLRKGLAWTRTIRARWAAGGAYVLPTLAQAEACSVLIDTFTQGTIPGLTIPRAWRGLRDGDLAMGRVAGAERPKPGIYAHCYFHHADGAWPVLYAWLRLDGGLSDADAFEAAAQVASGSALRVPVSSRDSTDGMEAHVGP
jgi:hypothetical protein